MEIRQEFLESEFQVMKDSIWRLTSRVFILETFIQDTFGTILTSTRNHEDNEATANHEQLLPSSSLTPMVPTALEPNSYTLPKGQVNFRNYSEGICSQISTSSAPSKQNGVTISVIPLEQNSESVLQIQNTKSPLTSLSSFPTPPTQTRLVIPPLSTNSNPNIKFRPTKRVGHLSGFINRKESAPARTRSNISTSNKTGRFLRSSVFSNESVTLTKMSESGNPVEVNVVQEECGDLDLTALQINPSIYTYQPISGAQSDFLITKSEAGTEISDHFSNDDITLVDDSEFNSTPEIVNIWSSGSTDDFSIKNSNDPQQTINPPMPTYVVAVPESDSIHGSMVPKKFVCHICDKGFRRNQDLTVHQRVHTGEKPYSCSICSKKFSQSCSVTLHMSVHTGARPHVCLVCSKAFARTSHLNNHFRNFHKQS